MHNIIKPIHYNNTSMLYIYNIYVNKYTFILEYMYNENININMFNILWIYIFIYYIHICASVNKSVHICVYLYIHMCNYEKCIIHIIPST